MRIAVIGAGVSGLLCARLLCDQHDVRVFESNPRIGGHCRTETLTVDGQSLVIDTGVVTFNPRAYPLFFRMTQRLGVETYRKNFTCRTVNQATGLRVDTNFQSPFVFEPHSLFLGFGGAFLLEAVRLHWCLMQAPDDQLELPLGEFLGKHGFSRRFVNNFILPFLAGAWSLEDRNALLMTTRYVDNFLRQAGVLGQVRLPDWRAFKGGTVSCLEKLSRPFQTDVELGSPVVLVSRQPEGIRVRRLSGQEETFDHVVFAIPGDLALRLIEKPSGSEREILESFRSETRRLVVHSDESQIPFRSRAWNILIRDRDTDVRYGYGYEIVAAWCDLTQMQKVKAPRPVFFQVPFRGEHFDAAKIYFEDEFSTPCIDERVSNAQKRHSEISGRDRIHFCGAAWDNGLLEGAVKSAVEVAKFFGRGFESIGW